MFKKEEIIHCKSYIPICDYSYTNEREDFPSGIIHVDMDVIPDFFRKIDGNGKKYVVVSSCADYGIFEQSQYPPSLDFIKSIWLIPNLHRLGYNDLSLHARCNLDRCNINDRYSLRINSWTNGTFHTIPNNIVRWFTTNCGIQDKRVTPIPFGINNTNLDDTAVNALSNVKTDRIREKKIYCNFQFYTYERMDLFNYCKDIPEVFICERDVNYDIFLQRLTSCRFVLCPTGNGMDSYRTLETMYCGAIPIINNPYLASLYGQRGFVPIFYLNDLRTSSYHYERVYNTVGNMHFNPEDYEKLYLSYWRNLIRRYA